MRFKIERNDGFFSVELVFFCIVNSNNFNSSNHVDIRNDKSILIKACRTYNLVVWLANVGEEKDRLVPSHFKNCTDVFAFASNVNSVPNSDDYKIGHFAYDLKNKLEDLVSSNPKRFDFLDRKFFIPEVMAKAEKTGNIQFHNANQERLFKNLEETQDPLLNLNHVDLKPTLSKEEYIKKVNEIKTHIQLGDVYELNFCMDHVAENVEMDPVHVFSSLSSESESPFCVYYKQENLHVISLSPERFMAKRGNRLYSQPMKGTSKRDDQGLRSDPKERAENIMITDLVRNDLSKSAKQGSVRVDELCGVYPFGSVNQMISTVSCELAQGVSSEQAILNAFPMGSMTGAPKVRAMELIDELEDFSRGIYSGAIGYFAPNGDFDFNVVIRSLIYDSNSKKLSCPTGSAITIQSDPEKEYDECMLKAQWIKDKLNELCS
ncbi:MAG: para-aminobenzoate synthetase component 1 [Bacteroidia bacterium]|jgi:para-aminobenzoate synthetase component 1